MVFYRNAMALVVVILALCALNSNALKCKSCKDCPEDMSASGVVDQTCLSGADQCVTIKSAQSKKFKSCFSSLLCNRDKFVETINSNFNILPSFVKDTVNSITNDNSDSIDDLNCCSGDLCNNKSHSPAANISFLTVLSVVIFPYLLNKMMR